ncbi:unnamed protein product [Amaranthus hypochondriacus]
MLFVYSIAIFLMAAHNADAQNCANVKEPCDFFTPMNITCCKGMVCSMSIEKLEKNDTSLKGECEIDEDAPTCRAGGQPCGNLDNKTSAPATSSEDYMPELSANTTCCDHLECDALSRTCKFPGLTCRKDGQICGIVEDNPRIRDYQKALLSSNPFCCPGLECGALNWCYKPEKIECRKEGESCRLIGCCEGLHCNQVENDHTGEEQYKCQKKTCNRKGTCFTLWSTGCCDSHYCAPHWGFVGTCDPRN